MAFKQDTFWEEHPPVGIDKPDQPGLRLYEVIELRQIYRFILMMGLFLAGMVWLQWREPRWFDALSFLGLPFLIFLGYLSLSIDGNIRRHRAYYNDRATPEPGRLPDLLRWVANSKWLMDRLAPPEPLPRIPSIFQNDFPQYVGPFTMVAYSSFTLLNGIMALFLLPGRLPAGTGTLTFCALMLGLFGVPLFFYAWVYRRVRVGVSVMGTGDKARDGDRVLFHFEDVRAAGLCWDYLLGRPYLMLDVNGVPLRYYGTVSEPLHLLRLAKYRMPHLMVRT